MTWAPINTTSCVLLQEEEEEEENRLADMAERRYAEQRGGDQDPATVEQPEASGASFVNISFDLEPEAPLSPSDSNRVPSPLPSWRHVHISISWRIIN